jgi:hypothetical protein
MRVVIAKLDEKIRVEIRAVTHHGHGDLFFGACIFSTFPVDLAMVYSISSRS